MNFLDSLRNFLNNQLDEYNFYDQCKVYDLLHIKKD